MRKILILGAGSVFGNLNARHLLEDRNTKVFAVGRNPRLPEPFSLAVGEGDENYEYHQLHIVFELDRLKRLITDNKINIVINYAALAYANSWFGAQHYFRTNAGFVAELVDFLADQDFFEYFLQIGTSEVYGSTKEPATEDVIQPTSPYAVSKLAADLHLQAMSSVRGFECSIIRPSNCFGEGQYLYRILPKLILNILERKKFPLEGGGKAEKSFMHVENLFSAVDKILELKPQGSVFNCGPTQPISMLDLTYKTCQLMNVDPNEVIQIVEGRAYEDSKYWLDSTKLSAFASWEPHVSLEDGIHRMIEWVSTYKNELSKVDSKFILRA
jgi:dTDP-glucose 4,6-dehydratase